MTVSRLVTCAAVLLFAVGCEETPERVCTPGETQACLGAGACNGAQACTADGLGFGACDCGGSGADAGADGGDESDGGLTDGGLTDGGVTACDPIAQTGCAGGQRCALMYSAGNASGFECVAAGTIAAGAECSRPFDGADECAGGTLCLEGRCAAVCDAEGSAACATNEACVRFEHGLVDGGSLSLGSCIATCNPVTQVRLTDNAPACGSADPSQPNRGCFGQFGSPFTCFPSSSTVVHGEVANPSGGPVYLNSCAPGFLPLLSEEPGSTRILCAALCTPVETHASATSGAAGASPHACTDRGATDAECRFAHFVEPQPSAFGNEVGFCLDYADRSWDHDEDPATEPVPFPSCTALTAGDADGDGVADHLPWGCGPLP